MEDTVATIIASSNDSKAEADDDDDDDGMNQNQNQLLVSQFLSFTGTTDEEVARQYLYMSDYGLEDAVNSFWAASSTTITTTTTTTTMNYVVGEENDSVDEGGRDDENNCNDEPAEGDGKIQLGSKSSEDQTRTGSSSLREKINSNELQEGSSEQFSDPDDYDYILSDGMECDDDDDDGGGGGNVLVEEKQFDIQSDYDNDDGDNSSDEVVDPSPDYDYLGLDSVYEVAEEEEDEEEHENDHSQITTTTSLFHYNNAEDSGVRDNAIPANNDPNGIYPTKGHKVDIQPMIVEDDDDDGVEEFEDLGEEYILGTMMVRVLQARHVKSNPYNEGGGLIANLLSNHRRNRHHQRTTPSPASAGGGGYGTPTTTYSGNNQQLYATLSYRNQAQLTSMAMEHNGNGDYYWSRSDQSYFDVLCPAFPLKMNNTMHHPKSPLKASATHPPKNASHGKSNNNYPQHPRKPTTRPPSSPLLELSLYSKKNNSQGNNKQVGKWNPYQKECDVYPETMNDDYLVGKCYINVLRILCGKTPYFDEWCTIHSDDNNNNGNKKRDAATASETMAGRVRIVIEYEPTDPPPRPGDVCVFANVYPFVDDLYPIPPFSMIRTNSHRWSSSSTKAVARRPKTFCVEEVVGDHIVLSYHTPIENWKCTFEVHRYLLLCIERHQAAVEKVREQVLDLCDNLVQSPVVDVLTKTVSTLPDEGLVSVGTELVIGSLGLLGRWWENGVDGIIEDVVDGINLDGRHSQFLDEEAEGLGEGVDDGGVPVAQNPIVLTNSNAIGLTTEVVVRTDDRKALPGMPCCPITGVPMIEPVVAADGHTYERNAIARWLQTSSRSPLTGEILAHRELVPNYLLLSSLGNEVVSKANDDDEEAEIPGMLDVL